MLHPDNRKWMRANLDLIWNLIRHLYGDSCSIYSMLSMRGVYDVLHRYRKGLTNLEMATAITLSSSLSVYEDILWSCDSIPHRTISGVTYGLTITGISVPNVLSILICTNLSDLGEFERTKAHFTLHLRNR